MVGSNMDSYWYYISNGNVLLCLLAQALLFMFFHCSGYFCSNSTMKAMLRCVCYLSFVKHSFSIHLIWSAVDLRFLSLVTLMNLSSAALFNALKCVPTLALHNTTDGLKHIKNSWQGTPVNLKIIPGNYHMNPIERMSEVCKAVIKAKGGYFFTKNTTLFSLLHNSVCILSQFGCLLCWSSMQKNDKSKLLSGSVTLGGRLPKVDTKQGIQWVVGWYSGLSRCPQGGKRRRCCSWKWSHW